MLILPIITSDMFAIVLFWGSLAVLAGLFMFMLHTFWKGEF